MDVDSKNQSDSIEDSTNQSKSESISENEATTDGDSVLPKDNPSANGENISENDISVNEKDGTLKESVSVKSHSDNDNSEVVEPEKENAAVGDVQKDTDLAKQDSQTLEPEQSESNMEVEGKKSPSNPKADDDESMEVDPVSSKGESEEKSSEGAPKKSGDSTEDPKVSSPEEGNSLNVKSPSTEVTETNSHSAEEDSKTNCDSTVLTENSTSSPEAEKKSTKDGGTAEESMEIDSETTDKSLNDDTPKDQVPASECVEESGTKPSTDDDTKGVESPAVQSEKDSEIVTPTQLHTGAKDDDVENEVVTSEIIVEQSPPISKKPGPASKTLPPEAQKVSESTVKSKEAANDSSSGQKDKSKGIDAIAKKLGLQIQGNSNLEVKPAAKTETPEEKGDVSGGKVDSSTVDKADVPAPKTESSGEKLESKEKGSSEAKPKSKKGNKTCAECGVTKGLKFQVLYQGKKCFMCSDTCFKSFRSKQKLAAPPPKPAAKEMCTQCKKEMKDGEGFFPLLGESKPLCSEECLQKYQQEHALKKSCSQCKKEIENSAVCLTWETMEFCNEDCLGKFQAFLGSHCTCCQSPVQQASLGKYCVRFGSDIRQFCTGLCLEEFKKGLKVCSFCQKDLSSGQEGFLAPVGDKGQFKDFCTQQCMERYETMNSPNSSSTETHPCSFCKKTTASKMQIKQDDKTHHLCSEVCVSAYRYANKINSNICDSCYKLYGPDAKDSVALHFEGSCKQFCSKACMTLFVLSHRKIVPCATCKVKKYNFDMIEKSDNGQNQLFCSLNCLSLFRVSINATSTKIIRCDHCSKNSAAMYHLTMSDGSVRNFCTYNCVIAFQNQFTNVPTLTTATPSARQAATTQASGTKTTSSTSTPVISSVMSLAPSTPTQRTATSPAFSQKIVTQKATPVRSLPLSSVTSKASNIVSTATSSTSSSTGTPPGQPVAREVIVKPPAPKSLKNKTVLCKPIMQSKGVSCKPQPCHKAVQTDDDLGKPIIVPVPVPVYVPTPVVMYSRPVPCPVPFPVPIPVPIFVPTTKDSPNQIMKQLKDIQEKIPANPFEAELLMMAEMAAEKDGKKSGEKTPVSDAIEKLDQNAEESAQLPLRSTSDSFGIPLDLESVLPPTVVTPVRKEPDCLSDQDEDYVPREGSRTRARSGKRSVAVRGRGRGRKRPKLDEFSADDSDSLAAVPMIEEPNTSLQPVAPDAHLCLKYTFGVNAWKHWVLQKNAQLEKGSQSSRKFKLFKTDLLQLPPDELNYSLCLFVKEVRKPNGEEYAADSIYYLCLGIQQYLFENGRIDNIFTDAYYEKFTECLHDVLQKQEELMTVEGSFASRIEEEILWESKQLGAHSPHVLLNTLMYFNTKHFMLRTVEDHTHLSFSHITKHWRKTPSKGGTARNVFLRYFPPMTKDTQRRRKDENAVYEQAENTVNPLRCPVKLYEFYLSKCPESVKARNDVFYLYPERSCVPDSPVWYSTQPLGQDTIAKMLQRIKTVREINET